MTSDKRSAVAAAVGALVEAYEVLERASIADAAEAAYTPGGPTLNELERLIAERRRSGRVSPLKEAS